MKAAKNFSGGNSLGEPQKPRSTKQNAVLEEPLKTEKRRKGTKTRRKQVPQPAREPELDLYNNEDGEVEYVYTVDVAEPLTPTVEFDPNDTSVAKVTTLVEGGGMGTFTFIHDAKVATIVADLEHQLQMYRHRLAQSATDTHKLVEAQTESLNQALTDLQAELNEEKNRKREETRNNELCPFCFEYVRDAWYVDCGVCSARFHYGCLTRTLFHNALNANMGMCPECMRRSAVLRTQKYREALMDKYDVANAAITPPSFEAQLHLCLECGIDNIDLRNMKDPTWVRNLETVNKLYGFYKSITLDMMAKAKLNLEKLLQMGITVQHLVRDKGARMENLLPDKRNRTGDAANIPVIGIQAKDFARAQADIVLLVRLGFNSTLVRARAKSWNTILDMNLTAESMCILGLNFVEFAMSGMRKELIKSLDMINMEQWVRMFGLDRDCLRLIGVKQADLEPKGLLSHWRGSQMATLLDFNNQEYNTYFRPDKKDKDKEKDKLKERAEK